MIDFVTARKKAGLTQAEVAADLGVTTAAVSLWENGKTMPKTENLPKLAALYKVSLDELILGCNSDDG